MHREGHPYAGENFLKNEQAELVKNWPPSYLPLLLNLHSFLLWEEVSPDMVPDLEIQGL